MLREDPNIEKARPKGRAQSFFPSHVHIQYTKIDPRVVKRNRDEEVTLSGVDETFTAQRGHSGREPRPAFIPQARVVGLLSQAAGVSISPCRIRHRNQPPESATSIETGRRFPTEAGR